MMDDRDESPGGKAAAPRLRLIFLFYLIVLIGVAVMGWIFWTSIYFHLLR